MKLIATTSADLEKPIISLSVLKTFDSLFWGYENMICFSENHFRTNKVHIEYYDHCDYKEIIGLLNW